MENQTTYRLTDQLRSCIGQNDLFYLPHQSPKKDSFFSKKDVFKIVERQGKVTTSPVRIAANYICLTSIIFASLLFVSNFSAYWTILQDRMQPDQLARVESSMESAMFQANTLQMTDVLTQEEIEKSQARDKKIQLLLQKHLERKEIAIKNDIFSAEKFNQKNTALLLDYEITPYQNRILIPKIGKNIPVVDVENNVVQNSKEWHKIFMRELANGVIKYPGSADPGQIGNSFIFGHSSNFPWAKGQYNEVFALLDKLESGDEIVTFHGQKKYTYKVFDKKVVKPGYVSALETNNERKLMTLMTCWPVGTTLNRLLVLAEMTEEDIATDTDDVLAMQF